jgi:hypothetical protein
VFGVGTERAEAPGEVRFAVLEASEVGGEPGEVASGSLVVALGPGLQGSCFALGQPRAEQLAGDGFRSVHEGSFHGGWETCVSWDVCVRSLRRVDARPAGR